MLGQNLKITPKGHFLEVVEFYKITMIVTSYE